MVLYSGLDAVLCATPIHLNAEVTKAALRAGKDVFVEKPPVLTMSDAREMQELSDRIGATVTVLEQILYAPETVAIRENLHSGDLGRSVLWEKISHYPIEDAGDYADTAWRREADFPLGLILTEDITISRS